MKFLFFILVFPCFLFCQTLNKVELYIEKYKELAINHMFEYGIPASITLAQGILESGSGKSELAVKSNNHFGIKCHSDWSGARSYYDDDEENECFRKYDSAVDSYLDHSLFLKNKSRYSNLFSLKITDYKGWSKGLKKAGYATDPNYANNLIRLIEKYYLYDYDKVKKQKPLKDKKTDSVVKYLIKKCNDVPYIISKYGDTYQTIADDFGIWLSELTKYNDVMFGELQNSKNSLEFNLKEGERVYLKPKRRSNRNPSFHVVSSGQTMRKISQLYAVKLSILYKKNELFLDRDIREGDIVYLKSKRKKN